MAKKMKRFLAMALAAFMIVGMMPVSAFAAEGGVAKIGEISYASFYEAVKAADENQTITLLADADLAFTDNPMYNNVNVSVIDLAGHTLTIKEGDIRFSTCTIKNGNIVVDADGSYTGNGVFYMFGENVLTLDNVRLTAENITSYSIFCMENNSDLILQNGTEVTVNNCNLYGVIAAVSDGENIIDNSKITVTNLTGRGFLNGNYTVKGGSEITMTGVTKDGFYIGAGDTLNIQDTAKVNITLNADGDDRYDINLAETATYTKADTATVNATTNRDTSAPAVAQIGQTKYETLAAAITAAQAGDTITLLADVTENVTINKNLTIDGDSFKYTGKMDLKNVSVTIENVNFVKGQINKDKNGTSENVTIKNCTFDGQGLNGYAINLNTTNYIVIENCTAENYVYGFLQVPSSNASVSVKNVKISSVAYGAKIDYSNGVTLENVTIEEATVAGILDSNFGAKTITLKNCTIYAANPIAVWERNTTVTDTFKFEGTNDFGTEEFEDEMSQYAKLVLADTGATLEACAGLSVTTTVADYTVVYENGIYKVAEANYVAQIGETKYETLQAAINAAQNGDTITLLADCGEDVTIKQANDVEITIDGADMTYTGTITVDGGSKRYATAALTIQNVKFDATDITKDASINLGADNNTRYTDNVTVSDCSFTGTGNAKAGIKQYTGGCKNLIVKDCTATGMHSLIQLKNIDGVTVSDCEITGSKSGISLGASSNVMVSNCKMNVTDYGIRADGTDAYDTTVEGCTISANLPIVVRNATGAYELTLKDTNTLTASNTEGYQIIFTNEDDGIYVAPTGDFVLTGADGMKVFPTYVAQIGETNYMTLAAAIAAAQNGETVTVLTDITLTEGVTVPAGKAVTLDLNGKTISGVCNANQGLITVENTAKLTIKDSSDPSTGKITYAAGNSNVGYVVDVKGDLVLESGTLELTGTWNIGYAVDVRPNAWGTAYTAPTTFVMDGGKIVSSDGGVRVASTSYENYTNVSASFTMNGGTIDAAWDGIFVQQSDATWDVLNVTINGGTIESDLNPIRFYGPAAASYVNGEDCVEIALNGGTLKYTGTEAQTWLVDKILRVGGGATVEEFLNDATVTASESFATVGVADGYKWVEDGEGYVLAAKTYVAQVGETKYESLQAAIDAAQAGDTVELLANIELTEGVTVPAGKDITLDLNGQTVSMSVAAAAESALITNKGTLTIKDSGENGKLTYASSNTSNNYSTSTIINNGTLTVENGAIENTSEGSGAAYAIDSSNTLTVNDGTISAERTAIRQVQNGSNDNTVTVTGGTISGGNGGLLVHGMSNAKKTTTKIEGGKFEGTYAFYTYFTVADSSNTEITVNGGTFNGYVMPYNVNNGSTNLNVSITNGTFGETYVYTKDASGNMVSVKSITGGTFANDVNEYCAEGYYAIDNDDNTWTVKPAVDVGYVAWNVKTGTYYETVSEGLSEAVSGQTVQLLTNCEDNYVLVTPGVTLDLNGYTLEANYVVGFDTANVIDSTNVKANGYEAQGLLVVDPKNIVLHENNEYVPVYSSEKGGYIFVKFLFASQVVPGDGQATVNMLVTSHTMEVIELLKDGAEDNDIQIVVRLTWNNATGTAYQDFVFSDTTIQEVMQSNKGTATQFDLMFYVNVTGLENLEGVTATAMVVTGSNVVCQGDTMEVN